MHRCNIAIVKEHLNFRLNGRFQKPDRFFLFIWSHSFLFQLWFLISSRGFQTLHVCHACAVLVNRHELEPFAERPLGSTSFIRSVSFVKGACWVMQHSDRANKAAFVYYCRFVVNARTDATAMLRVAAPEYIIISLERFPHAAKRGGLWLQCFDLWLGQGNCRVPVVFFLMCIVSLALTTFCLSFSVPLSTPLSPMSRTLA